MKWLFLLIISFIITSGFLITPVLAQENPSREQKIVVLPKEETVDKDYFAVGDTITLSGTVNGDAYLAGGNIVVEGVVNGDLLVAGGNLIIRGRVTEDVRAVGGNITISGEVGRNLTVAGGSVTVTDGARLAGSLVGAGGSLQLFAPVPRDLTIAGGQVTVGNSIEGGILAGVGEMVLTPNARVAGDINYWSDQDLRMQQGASVSGKLTRNSIERETRVDSSAIAKGILGFSLFLKLISILSSLVLGLILIKLLPVYSNKAVENIRRSPWMILGVGFLALIITPIIVVALLITVIGIPLGLILMVGYIILIFLSKIFVSLFIGQKTLGWMNQKAADWQAFILGLFIYGILSLIPIIGGIISFIVLLMGMGTILVTKKQMFADLRKKNLI